MKIEPPTHGDSNNDATTDIEPDKPSGRRHRRRYKDFEGDLTKEIEDMKAKLLSATAQNQQLRDMEAALESHNEQAAYLSSVLARADLTCSILPSTRLLPQPIGVAINKVMESVWGASTLLTS